MKWIKLTESSLPQPNRLVWCKRTSDNICLATRQDRSFAKNKDLSQECYWHGFSDINNLYKTSGINMESGTSFHDLTVSSWSYVEKPK